MRRGGAETRGRGEGKIERRDESFAPESSPRPRVPASPRHESAESRFRMFCAVPLSEDVRESVARYIESLRHLAPDVRASWDRPEKMHITLKFLGDIEASRVEALSRAAERAAREVEAFILLITGAGVFPARGLARVLWLGIEDETGSLARLQSALETESEREGFRREERSFHPHLTIARLRKPEGARKIAQLHQDTGFEAVRFPVSELLVIRSELGPQGSRYTEISKHQLKSVPPAVAGG
ncbi:MAG: 2'-5' RNA ligase [Acidobacteria bacterium 13_1_20CM_3_53_8]|nr:MAG: 2'-5' RNA ligase [Acidobacteria bacterium 13_1_20CM_3_53_8]